MHRQLFEVAAELHRRHRPYVLATVVWSRRPTSGKQGSHAIVEPDGTIHGWIGGACAEPAVLREARRVLNDGEPKLLHLGPEEEPDGVLRRSGPGDTTDVLRVPIACASEGALEVFMEPVLPQPLVVLVGRSPAVRALADLLATLDWRGEVVDDPAALANAGVDDTSAIVIATQGHDDEAALEAALATDAAWIGLVASRRRGETLLGYLRDRGHSDDELARVHSPAGLDLGRIEHREIGVAILAELVALKARGGLGGAAEAAAAPEPATATDPVCGMEVEVAGAKFTSEHHGMRIVFCCPACKRLFDADPDRYLDADHASNSA